MRFITSWFVIVLLLAEFYPPPSPPAMSYKMLLSSRAVSTQCCDRRRDIFTFCRPRTEPFSLVGETEFSYAERTTGSFRRVVLAYGSFYL